VNKTSRICFSIITISILFFCIKTLAYASSQTSIIELGSTSIDEVLAGTVINCMFQDSQGYLWFGTQIGLYRYNGYSLKAYNFSSTIKNKFISNFITSLCEDNNKNLWVGTFGGGLFKLNTHTDDYKNFNNNPDTFNSLSDNNIRTILKDDSGKLWIGTQNKGLDCLDPNSENFSHFINISNDATSLSSNSITSICKDKAGILWIGTSGGGLNKFDLRLGKFSHYKNQFNASDSADQYGISKIYLDKRGILWIATGDGRLNTFDTSSEKFIKNGFDELKAFKVNNICEDSSGTLWVGTYGNGVKVFDRDSGKFTPPGCNYSQNTSLCNYRVISLYPDSSGNLWVGTEGTGVSKINTNLNFTSYMSNKDSGITFSDDVILSICKDSSGNIWLGTANGGINKFDRQNRRITHYKNNPKDSTSLSSNSICSIYEDSRQDLWFGTIDGTLNRFESDSGKFIHYTINNVENSNNLDNGILRMYEDKYGILWICSANGGLIKLDRNTEELMQFTANSQSPSSISSNHVLTIAEDDMGILWVGTGDGGLNKMDPSSGTFTHYGINDPGSTSQTFNYSVNAIVNDGSILWLATDRGLIKFDKASGKSILLDDAQKTASSNIYGLLQDDNKNLWLSTTNGLVKYSIKSKTFKKYDFTEGLQRNQYTSGAYYRSTDGEMFIGGTNGFSCFYADKIKDNTHMPPIVITDFKIFDTSTKLTDTGKVSLTYKDNYISFEFAALDYANPAKNQYAYMLEGFDTDWHYNVTRNYASYTNLAGGEYVLKIKASNNDGIWNEQGTQIKIVIKPPFWKTAWFIVAAFAFALVAVIAFIKLRTRAISLKNLELERQIIESTKELNQANEQLRHTGEMKSNFLSVVSHEIRTPLCAILGFTELIADKIERIILPNIDLNDKKIYKAAEKISRDLNIIISEGDRLSTLVNTLLNVSKIEAGKMDFKSEILEIGELVDQSLLITKPIIEKARLAIYVDIEADLPKVPGDRDMLTQVFINLISNAVRFTKEGYIKVCAKKSHNEILVSIEDTGIGIDESRLNMIFERFYKVGPSTGKNYRNDSIGLGLYICKQIIENHRGKIWMASEIGKGSIIYFTIPA
jgi:signal transduction histidine kinase/ligand-binding sensor domain-containing protein